MATDWNFNRIPDLTMVRNAMRAEQEQLGREPGEVTLKLNGTRGGWDVEIISTDVETMDQSVLELWMDDYGNLERV